MSHITRLKTVITKKFILSETLNKLSLPWKAIDHKTLSNDGITTDLKKNPRLDFIVSQDNGSDITFLWSGQSYEIGIDLSKWQQSRSINSFMARIQQQYSLILLNTSAENSGFKTSVTATELIDQSEENQQQYTLICKGWK